MSRPYEKQDTNEMQSQTRPSSCVSMRVVQMPAGTDLYLAISAKAFDTITYRGGSSG